MEWFRHYHGLSTDPKLTVAGLTAEVTHCVAVAAWCFALEYASGNDKRGSIDGMSAKVMAVGLRLTLAEAERIIAAFQAEGMIGEDGCVTAWSRRQRPSDSSAERVRAWRQKRDASVVNATEDGDVTLHRGIVTDDETDVNATEQARAEQNRVDKTQTPTVETQDTVPTTVGQGQPVEVTAPIAPSEPAAAPIGAQPESAKAALWREMKAQIGGKNPGALVGRWAREHGIATVADAHYAAMANVPADYVSWMTARLAALAKPSGAARSAAQSAAKPTYDEQLRRREAEQQATAEGFSIHTAEGRNRVAQILGSANGKRSAA